MFPFRRSAACALAVTVVTLGCGLTARAQVGVPQQVPVAPVGVPPVGAGVSAVNTGLLLLIGQIADGQMTVDEAWEKGLLDAPKVLQLLGQSQRLTEDASNETLQRDLAGLLVRFAPATVATPEKLSARVRVALCRYYADNGDARAVPLCEALIAEKLNGQQIKQPLSSNPDGGSSSLWLTSIISLARYYENTSQWQKAGETWERALAFWQDVDWFQAGVRIDAARVYGNDGADEKSKQLYAQVPQYGNEQFAGLAIYDQSYALITENKHDEARALLQSALLNNQQSVRVALLSLMGYSYYKTGDIEKARDFFQQAIAAYQKLPANKQTPDLEGSVRRATTLLSLTQPKVVVPLSFEPGAIYFVAASNNLPSKGATRAITQRLVVRALKPVALTITSDSPAITVEMGEVWKPLINSDWMEKEVKIQLKPELMPEKTQTLQATLKVSSAQIPNFEGKVPVSIELR